MHRLLVLLIACGPTTTPPKQPPAPAVPVVTNNPCFAGKPPMLATALWKDLEKYSWSVFLGPDEQPPPPTTYGSCKVERNQVKTASGQLVAELGCGVRVLVPGIHDGLGLELGTATGKDVLDRWPKPQPNLTCIGNGPDQARCHFDRPEDSDTSPDSYVVAGALGQDALAGEAARAFVADKRIVEVHVSMWCH